MIIGGSALSRGLCEAALDHGIDISAGYGMSQTCPTDVHELPPHMRHGGRDEQAVIRRRTRSPVALADLRIIDADEREVPRPREGHGRDRGLRALAHPGRPEGARRVRTCGPVASSHPDRVVG